MKSFPFALRATVIAALATLPALAATAAPTTTPIKHLIVVIGENVTFDTLYGTYVPPRGQSIYNLVSQGIVKPDGTPAANYAKAVQSAANGSGQYALNPQRVAPLAKLPQPTMIGLYNPSTLQPYGAIPDPRFAALTANGPFQITKFASYNTGVGDPVHRFFQMWQQTGGSNEKLDLFAWVASTVGQGGATDGVTAASTGQGGELMGFFNMNQGDAPYFKQLAQNWALSDNYHQFIMGGTGANFFGIATGDAAVYKLNGQLAVPPANQIENPDPQAQTANFYTNDGYAGGSYVNCADLGQPGVAAVRAVLDATGRAHNCESGAYYLVNNYEPPYDINGNAKTLGATTYVYPPQTVPTIGEALSARGVSWSWYTGGRDDADVSSDALFPTIKAQVAAAMKTQLGLPQSTPDAALEPALTALAIKTGRPYLYNSIGDPHNASANVVGTPALKANLKGLNSFYSAVAAGTLPEVSYVVPKNLDSGHPGYSAPARYEGFLQDLITKVQANPALWADTAIVITTDEGGGYFDSGYIQNLDFFGDGPRIPLIVVSPYAKRNFVDHTYNDHSSVLKFIERNWSLPPLSARSRDNLPNPVRDLNNPYRPANQPAIGDLSTLFNFPAAAAR
ncbi:alkaline phosphatase family protein [Roseateles koreensis]|uniref:Alkaline phosphatase family protein n=1 Tax=Roseateles koreensis TaxID=2987526 RepID=A0ABT5KP38_9BURK|nr:alkaline phosphatase family protein [Roseateles koreensis]MDC8784678.1 alkaline phosphatase family protein [Roseateles koreensis]